MKLDDKTFDDAMPTVPPVFSPRMQFDRGDRVRCVNPCAGFQMGGVYTVDAIYGVFNGHQYIYAEGVHDNCPVRSERFVLDGDTAALREKSRQDLRMSDAETIREEPTYLDNAAQEFAEIGMLAVRVPHEGGCSHCDHGKRPCICPGTVATKLSHSEAAAIENTLAAEALGAPVADMVNLPKHYARFKIEPVRFIVENGLDWFQGNIVKYVLRHDAKNGREDLKKAERYLKQYIAFKDGDADWWRLAA